ncbi:MAG: RNB domain-containing ribonuclease [Micavibrio sp.]
MRNNSEIVQEPDKDSIYRLIAMNPAPLTRVALRDAFEADEDKQKLIDECLAVLVAEGAIAAEGRRGFVALKPWADMAYAVVGEHSGYKRVPVTIQNLPEGISLSATIPHADVTRNALKPGDKIVVALARGQHATLRGNFVARAAADKPFRLTGTFNQKAGIFVPLDRSIKTGFVLNRPPAGNVQHQFLAEIPHDFSICTPQLRLVDDQMLDGVTGNKISLVVAKKHDIDRAYPEDVLREARNIRRRKMSFDQRVDMRSLEFRTVDPLGARDLDDAFAAEIERDGYSVYTAIADVPAHVAYNSAIDRDAYERGVSFYLADDTFHMLPPSLSTSTCSLVSGVDRLAIVVRQNLDWDCNLKSYDVYPAVIRSREQLTYGQFYDLMERDDPRFRTIRAIHEMRRGKGLNAEFEQFLKEDPNSFNSKSIVETLMVQTNSLLAHYLHEADIPFLSRNFEQAANGVVVDGKPQRAYYSSESLGHGALRLLRYGHFTSPIRRYADLVNIRGIHKALGMKRTALTDEQAALIDQTAHHLNMRRRIDRDVQHDFTKYHAIPDMKRLSAAPVRVFIDEVADDYVEVVILQTGLRQRLMRADLQARQWDIESGAAALVYKGDEAGKARSYHKGESILGRICDVDPAQAKWQLLLMPTEFVRKPSDMPKPSPI